MPYNKNPFGRQYTDSEGHTVDKKGNRIDVEEYDVTMYRSYGVHKKHRPWLARFYEIFAIAVVLLVYIPIFAIAALAVIMTVRWAGVYAYNTIVTFFLCVGLAIYLYLVVLKLPRKRITFYRRLKKVCRKNGYRLELARNFFQTLFWADDDKIDFTVKAGRWIYYVKLFGSKNMRSDITFSDGELVYRKLRLENRFTDAFALKPRATKKKVDFPKYTEGDRAIRVIILNPAPTEVYKRKANGDIEMSGNCDTIFGYTIYTGSGFIEAIRRNAVQDKLDMKSKSF